MHTHQHPQFPGHPAPGAGHPSFGGPRPPFGPGMPGPGMPGPQMPPHHGFPPPPADQEIPEALRGPRAPRRRPGWRVKAGALTAIVAVSTVAWMGLAGSGDGSGAQAQVQLETVASAGSMPFTAPVGNDVQDVAGPENAAGPQAGNTGGLYAQDPAAPACDTQALIAQLTADPAKAAAWGRPLDVEADGISGFVSSLTPVTLRADTAVTEYGYAEGAFQPYPATLQAGTAVLVNSYGEPTVKCHNGNPLAAATASNDSGRPTGATWAGFTAERTIRVTPAPAPQRSLTVVNTVTNTTVPTPVKPDPRPEVKPNPAPQTTPEKQLRLTGTHNYDGTVTLSDGRIMRPDGSFLKPAVVVEHPLGSTTNRDGSITHPDGRVFNIDGTERRPIAFAGATVNPDGSITPAGVLNSRVRFNHDGSFSLIFFGNPPNAKPAVTNVGPDGKVKSGVVVNAGERLNDDGSVVKADGTVVNADGTVRPPKIILPDNSTLDPKGGTTPPLPAVPAAGAAVADNKPADDTATKQLAGEGLTLDADGIVDTAKLPQGATVNPDGTITLEDGAVINPDGSVKTPAPSSTLLPDGTVRAPAGPVPARVCGTGVVAEDCTTGTGPTTVEPQVPEVPQVPAGTSTTDGGATSGSGGSGSGSSSTDGAAGGSSSGGSSSGSDSSGGSSSGGSSSGSDSSGGGEAQTDAG